MVTIGPLVVLGLLGVTFYIGARPMTPVATNVPIIRQAHSRSQPDLTVLETANNLRSGPGLQRAQTSDTPSEDALQTMNLSNSGAGLQRSRRSGRLDGTVVVSPSEHPKRWAGAAASEHRTAEGTSNNPFAFPRSRRPAMSAGSSAARPLPPGEEHISSGTINLSASSDDVIAIEKNRPKGHSGGEGMVEAGSDPVASPATTERRPQDKSPRSFRGVWKAGPGNTSDPEQVLLKNEVTKSYCFAVGLSGIHLVSSSLHVSTAIPAFSAVAQRTTCM